MASRRKKTRPDYSDEREAAGPADYDSDDSVADPNYMPQDDDVFLSDPAIPPVNTTTTSPASPAPSSSKSLRCSKFDHYFEISEDRSSAVCKICMSKKLKVALKMSHRSTSGLKKHLQRHHKEEFNKMFPDEELKIAPKQQTLLTSIFGKRKMDSESLAGMDNQGGSASGDVAVIGTKLVDWLASKYLPFSFFDDERTQDFFHTLNDTVAYPKRNAMRTMVLRRFDALQKAVIAMLSENSSKISFTIDGWTSIAGRCYYGITAHYIDNNWTLKSIVLDFIAANGQHTGKDIAEFFSNSLKKHKILSKVQGITVDNAAVNTKFMKELEDHILDFDSENSHFRCFAHILNLAVQALMKTLLLLQSDSDSHGLDHEEEEEVLDIDICGEHIADEDDDGGLGVGEEEELNFIARIRELFKKIKRSEQLRERYIAACKTVQIDNPKGVILDCQTRWNSTYLMLAHAIETKAAINVLCDSDEALRRFKVQEDEWKTLKIIEGFLKKCKKISEVLGGDKYVTLTNVVVYINLLLDYLDLTIANIDNDLPNALDIKNAFIAARNKIIEYYNKSNWVYCIAMCLDPRHKLQALDLFEWGRALKAETESKLRQLYHKYREENNEAGTAAAVGAASSSSTSSEDDFNLSSYYKKETPIADELDRYLAEKRQTGKIDVLTWWKDNEANFPTLARMARDFLSIPATSVPAERLFSRAGLVISKERSRLTLEAARALLCIQSWTAEQLLLESLKKYL